MEAKSLRIGNYVKGIRLGKVKTIYNLHFQVDDIDCISLGNSIQENFKPIPLTEEWLLKFGFEKGTIENDNWAFTVFFYDIWRVVYKEKKGYGTSDVYLENFYSVNQLQNLYFALTNKEL